MFIILVKISKYYSEIIRIISWFIKLSDDVSYFFNNLRNIID